MFCRLAVWGMLFVLVSASLNAQEKGAGANWKRIVTYDLSPLPLPDSASLIPGSVQVWELSSGKILSGAFFDYNNGVLYWKANTLPIGFPVEVRYRLFPAWLTQPRFLLDSALLDTARQDLALGYRYAPYSEPDPSINFRKMDYSGSFTRGIALGNTQDLALNSSFNLQLSGDLGDGMEIRAAISDENLPLQPEGNSLQLREFDRVFVQIKRRNAEITAGDYDLRPENGYFLQYYNRLQGGQVRLHQQDKWRHSAAFAIARGKFTRYTLPTQEGNQGPYPLQGGEGERFIVILAGTERVWLNGQLLQRGADQDYVIDYNRGELQFTAKRLITRESRVAVEYEYADQNFVRSVYALHSGYTGKQFKAYFNAYSRQDSRTPTANLELSLADREILSAAGDDPEKALISGLQLAEAFSPSRVFYAFRDTLGPCGRQDSILVYSTNPEDARANARFTFLGQGKGNYRLAPQQTANERIFEWVGPDPLTCLPQGEYEPVVRLAPPQQQQLFTLGQEWTLGRQGSWVTEVALSHLDRNRLSPLGHTNDWGWAALTRFQKRFRLSDRPAGWLLSSNLSMEILHPDFQPINPYRNPEFLRDWSLADFLGQGTTVPAREFLARGEARLEHPQLGQTGYAFQSFLRGDIYRGEQHRLDWSLRPKTWEFLGNVRLLDAQKEGETNRFLRPNLEIRKAFPRIGGWTVFLLAEGEQNARKQAASDSLLQGSFAFWNTQAGWESPKDKTWAMQVQASQRQDWLPQHGVWKAAIRSRDYSLTGQWQRQQKARISGNLRFRNLRADTLLATGLDPQRNTLLGRLDANLNGGKGFFRSNTVYELGSGQEPRLEFTYIKVAPGEGAYIWQDSLYNNDGVIQPYEMEIAPFQDLADYIRIATVSAQFIRTDYSQLNQNLQIEPRALWKSPAKPVSKILSKLSGQFSWRIQQKNQAGGKGFPGFRLAYDPSDTAIVALNAGIRQSIALNRAHPKWELQWTRQHTFSKQAQTTGFELRELQDQTLQLRWNWAKQWTLRLQGSEGTKLSDSEFFNLRDYELRFYRLEAQASWLPVQTYRAQASFRYQQDENLLPVEPLRASSKEFSTEHTYNPKGNTSYRLRLSYTSIDLTGNKRSPAAFAILNGLQTGANWLWSLNADRQLNRSLQLRLTYDGRKTGTNAVVHTGSVQVTAVF